jgi:hypothetical protein
MTRVRATLLLGSGVFSIFAALAVLQALAAPRSSVQATAGARSTILVTTGKPTEYAFTLSQRQVPAGLVTFRVANKGSLAQTFKVCAATHGGTANACVGRPTPSIARGKTAVL